MANHVLHASAQSVSGYAVRCESRGFSYLLDEAIEDGGTDTGMSPLESLMASMGACKCITARAAAKLRKIDLSLWSVYLLLFSTCTHFGSIRAHD